MPFPEPDRACTKAKAAAAAIKIEGSMIRLKVVCCWFVDYEGFLLKHGPKTSDRVGGVEEERGRRSG